MIAVGAAWAHRAWLADDPCSRANLSDAPALQATIRRHDMQARALAAAIDSDALLRASNQRPADQAETLARASQAKAQAGTELASRQAAELLADCRRLTTP